MNFTTEITWKNGKIHTINVSGNSYDITGLDPGVSYTITLVAIGDGMARYSVPITVTTNNSKYVCMPFTLYCGVCEQY